MTQFEIIQSEEQKSEKVVEMNDFIFRHDLKNGRWYTKKDVWKPSATTVINIVDKGFGFEKWLGDSPSYELAMDYARMTADRGTRVHLNVGALLAGQLIQTENLEQIDIETKMLMSFIQWYQDIKPEIIDVEHTMLSPTYPVAGTADLRCYINGKLHVIDFKTGAHYPSHQLQLTAYGQLTAIEMDLSPEKSPIISVLKLNDWRKKPTYSWKKYDYDHERLMSAVSLWTWMYGSEPKIEEPLPEVLTLEMLEKEDDKG